MIQRWQATVNYEGTDYSDYYVAAQRMFKCSRHEAATFAYIRAHLNECAEVRGLNVIEVTWQDEAYISRYAVLVHKDFERGLRMARMFDERLATKGYVDPEATDDMDDDERDQEPSVDFNAAEPTGLYSLIKLGDGRFTTLSAERKNLAREKEAAKRAELLAELGTAPVARRIDGVQRRWRGVGYNGADGEDKDRVEA